MNLPNANDNQMANEIKSYGYGVYSVPLGFAVADPKDSKEGFYLVAASIDELYGEMQASERIGL